MDIDFLCSRVVSIRRACSSKHFFVSDCFFLCVQSCSAAMKKQQKEVSLDFWTYFSSIHSYFVNPIVLPCQEYSVWIKLLICLLWVLTFDPTLDKCNLFVLIWSVAAAYFLRRKRHVKLSYNRSLSVPASVKKGKLYYRCPGPQGPAGSDEIPFFQC